MHYPLAWNWIELYPQDSICHFFLWYYSIGYPPSRQLVTDKSGSQLTVCYNKNFG